jgi:hypothetical protein
MSEEKEFPDGLMIKPLDKLGWVVSGFGIKKPHDNAPDFVKVNISILIENLRTWFISFEKDGIANEWATLTINEPYFQGRIDIKVAEFKEWVISFVKRNPDKEWINLDINESREGRLYAVVNNREKKDSGSKPSGEEPATPAKTDDGFPPGW